MIKAIHNQHGKEKKIHYKNSKNPIQNTHLHLETLDRFLDGLDRVPRRPDQYSSKN